MINISTKNFTAIASKADIIKNKVDARKILQNLISERTYSSSTEEQAQQIKEAAKLAIEAVQSNLNSGGGTKELSESIRQRLTVFSKGAQSIFKELIEGKYREDLEITSFHRLRPLINRKLSFFNTNYTNTNQNLLKFIDNLDNSINTVDFLSSQSNEINLHILKFLSSKDQKNFKLVCTKAAGLVDDEHNSSSPLAHLKLSIDIITNPAKFDKFLEYLASPSCGIRSLDLSQTNSTEKAFPGPLFRKLFSGLKKNTSITHLNITGCALTDDELSLIGGLTNLQKITMTEGVEAFKAKALLEAKDLNLAFALENKNLITTLVKVIMSSSLTYEGKFELLAAIESGRVSGLYRAMKDGHAEAVSAFITAILNFNLSNQEKTKLIAAKRAGGTPGLWTAFHKGLTEAVSAFATAVLHSNLSNQQKAKLLVAKWGGMPGLWAALGQGYKETGAAFITAVLNSNLSNQEKTGLLAAKSDNGLPGLYLALKNGHAETVAAYTTAILNSDLLNQEKFELLAAKRADGTTGLQKALQNGYAEVVSVFTTAIINSVLPNPEKIELLAAKRDDGAPGLSFALKERYSEAVAKYTQVVLDSELSDDHKAKLLATKSLPDIVEND